MLGPWLVSALLSHGSAAAESAHADEPKHVAFVTRHREAAHDLKHPFRAGRKATVAPHRVPDLKDPFAPGTTTSKRAFEPASRGLLRDPFEGERTLPSKTGCREPATADGVVIQRPRSLQLRTCTNAAPPLRDPFVSHAPE